MESVIRSTSRRLWLMFALATLTAGALVGYGFASSSAFGLILAIAPGAAGVVALVSFIVYPSPRRAVRRVRSASLQRRTPSMFLSRRSMLAPIAAAAAMVLFLVYTGMTSTLDDLGLARALSRDDELGLQIVSPFPGWYYGVPLIILTVLLAILTVAALYRIAAAPTQPDWRARPSDLFWRERTSQLVVMLSTMTLLSYFVGVLAFAGNATRNVAIAHNEHGEQVVRFDDALLSGVELFGAFALFIVAAWLAVRTVSHLVRYQRTVTAGL